MRGWGDILSDLAGDVIFNSTQIHHFPSQLLIGGSYDDGECTVGKPAMRPFHWACSCTCCWRRSFFFFERSVKRYGMWVRVELRQQQLWQQSRALVGWAQLLLERRNDWCEKTSSQQQQQAPLSSYSQCSCCRSYCRTAPWILSETYHLIFQPPFKKHHDHMAFIRTKLLYPNILTRSICSS